ncbi:hypothetical protein N0807_27220 [Pseudomonas aeruginosa]|uniref:hypothetical protein n=1 Tax=Pseudomonas aeruginosa TaxID=287 RepID=UPI00106849EC|nr:hypothetical protein [Pseudomonas aeruginosa]ELQ7314403.1 hypothetical protein [Pseudomonas aeruginosa]ELQ7317135.1 hypothetical protein [Pseudomonas aeruginosa]ELQ7330891.1 hypothetical protein [Pseudomonas aeruginosa]ELQ7335914.1 hypothetical protein [Pseudomonas aeruginosa]ELQ7342304.1 hypothetical protein [Pseudomonas aeruginosa]
MAKTKKNSLRLDADFTEDTVGFALESFLSMLSFPRMKFSIEPFSRGRERWLGADARLNGHIAGFKPFYMQFKRPSAYPDTSTAKIITDRKTLKLPVVPRTLYFDLREKRPTHKDYQHNILYRLRQRLMTRRIGDAAYVCPLFLDRSAYRFHVHMAGLRRWPRFWHNHPWELEDILIHSSRGAVNFNAIPVMQEHVSIPPHAVVTNAKHSYSFTERGTDLCFHSPLSLPEGSRSLAYFLTGVVGNPQSDEGFISPERAQEMLRELFSGAEGEDRGSLLPDDFPQNAEDGIASWLHWGDYLKTEHQIEQFALVRWAD